MGVKLNRFDDEEPPTSDDGPARADEPDGAPADPPVPSRAPTVTDQRTPKPPLVLADEPDSTPSARATRDSQAPPPRAEQPARPAPPPAPSLTSPRRPLAPVSPTPSDDVALQRLACDAPHRLTFAVNAEVRRRQRQGRGGRRELALDLIGLLPRHPDDLDQLFALVDQATPWRTGPPKTRRLDFRVPPAAKEHVENLVLWAQSRAVDITQTDVIIAMVVAGIDLDAPPPGTGRGATALDRILAGHQPDDPTTGS